MEARHERLGTLDCIVIDGSEKVRALLILCHGYGAPGNDLAGLAPYLHSQLGEHAADYRMVFPAAPQSLAEMGWGDARAWWPINMARLAEMFQTARFDELHVQTPPGIDEARQDLVKTVAAAQSAWDQPVPLILGGFSQGAMVSMDAALRGLANPPDLLVQLSGTLICQSAWTMALRDGKLRATKVLQSHGRRDPVLPFSSAETLRDLLAVNKVDVDFHAFDGPHTIDAEMLTILATAMIELVS